MCFTLPQVEFELEFGRCTHRTSATSEQAGTSANRHQQIADTDVFKKPYHVFFLLNYNEL